MFRRSTAVAASHAAERELLRDLLHVDHDVRRHAARTLVDEGIVPKDCRTTALVVGLGPEGGDPRAVGIDLALRRAQRRMPHHTGLAMATGTTGGVLLVTDPKLPRREELAECAAALLDDIRRDVPVSGTAVRVGIGSLGHDLDDAAETHACATEAPRVAEAVPDTGDVVFWSDLGVYRLLVQLPLEKLRDDAIPPGLRRLLDEDPSRVLLPTLETYLDRPRRRSSLSCSRKIASPAASAARDASSSSAPVGPGAKSMSHR